MAPEGDASSRVVAAPELLPVPYAQRLQLSAAALGGMGVEGDETGGSEGGGGGVPTVVAAASGVVTSAGDPEAGDGMEHLTQQVGVRDSAAGRGCASMHSGSSSSSDPCARRRKNHIEKRDNNTRYSAGAACLWVLQAASLRFGRDLRLLEVRRLLRLAPAP